MESLPLISVIVPVYKVEAYLDRCVESIVNQTYRNLEIILVDDGSPDNCPAMCDAWVEKDSRIKVIHKENGGLSDARNAGMAVATGEYVAFIDSDDWVHSEYISLLHEAAKAHDAAIAACDFRFVYEHDAIENEPVTAQSECCTAEQAIESLMQNRRFRAVVWNKLYRRDILKGEQFPVGRYHEDEFFTYRMLDKAERLAYVDAPLYFYFQRPGSIMNSVSIKHLDALDAYLERLELFQIKYPGLYRKDKVTFCVACVSFYCQSLQQHGNEKKQMQMRIRECREKVHFSAAEIRALPLRSAIYALGTEYGLHPLCVILNLMRGR